MMMASGYNMLIPFLPMYLLKELGVPQESIGIWTGAVFSITFFIGGIMAPLWGKLADKHGKKPMALRSGLMLSVSYFAMGMVSNAEELLLVRAFQGFAAGLISVFMAMCSASVPARKIGVSMGMFQSSLTVGTVVGPLLGGALATFMSMRSSFYVAGTLLLILSIVTWLFLPEPSKGKKRVENKIPTTSVMKRPEIREVLFLGFALWFVILIVQPIMTLYVAELNHSSENAMLMSGAIFSIIGIAGGITAPFWGKYGQSKGFYKTLALGLLLGSVASYFNSVPETVLGYALANLVFSLIFGGVLPSCNSIIAKKTADNERGRAYAYMFSAQQFGSMLGPLAGGLYTTYMPMNTVYYISSCIMFILGITVFIRHRGNWKG